MVCLRKVSLTKFNEILNDDTLAADIEKNIYNTCISEANKNGIQKKWDNNIFRGLYNDKIRHILINLDINSTIKNNYLYDNIKNGNILPSELGKMDPQNIFPDKWKPILDKFIKQEKIAEETKNLATTDLYKCPKCKKNKTTYYKLQIRCADEPETTFLTCVLCKNQWRVN